MTGLRQHLLGGILAFVVALVSPLCASETVATGSEDARVFNSEVVKAAFLINFVRFTEWPSEIDSSAGPINIVIGGNRELEDALLRIADRQRIRDRSIRVVRLRGPLDLDAAHLVYLEDQTIAGVEYGLGEEAVLSALRGKPVLTAGMSEQFIARGGMVRLYRSGENLRFEINPERTAAAGLKASSRLLALGRVRSEALTERAP